MSKQTSVKIAATIAAVLAIPLALQRQSNASTHHELAAMRSAPKAGQPTSNGPALAAINAEIAAKRDAATEAERRIAELKSLKLRFENEVMLSFGSVDQMAKELIDLMDAMDAMDRFKDQIKKGVKPDESTEESKKMAAEIAANNKRVAELTPKAFAVLRQIPSLEKTPKKAARFYTTLVGELEGLDERTRAAIEKRTTEWVRELQASSLALPQRPEGEEERRQWYQRRGKATFDFLAEIEREIPGGKFREVEAADFQMKDSDDHSMLEMLFE